MSSVIPIKCTYCGKMIIKLGLQKDSLFRGIVVGKRLPFHKSCYLSVYPVMRRPEVAAKVSKALTGRTLSKEHRQKISDKLKLMGNWIGDKNPMNNPEVVAKISKALKGRKNPEQAQRMRDNNPMKNPVSRKRVSDSLKGLLTGNKNPAKRPEVRKILSERMMGDKNPSKRPEQRQRMRDKNPTRLLEVRTKISEAAKKRWINMTKEERRQWFKDRNKKPNNSEKRIDEIVSPLGFEMNVVEYEMIGGYIPDFIHNTEYLIIEYDGYLGHNPSSPWTPDTWEECLALDDARDQAYRDASYKVLRIFKEDLAEGDDFVRMKIGWWIT